MLKQYIFIPIKPKMSKGKIASQAAHASYFAIKKQIYDSRNMNLVKIFSNIFNDTDDENLVADWEVSGNCVIVCEVKDQAHLIQIDKYLDQWKIPHHLYIDEGHTEVGPLTATALATGVVREEDQWMFEKFKLFNQK